MWFKIECQTNVRKILDILGFSGAKNDGGGDVFAELKGPVITKKCISSHLFCRNIFFIWKNSLTLSFEDCLPEVHKWEKWSCMRQSIRICNRVGMMKSTFRMLQCSILSLMSVLAGCNSDIFIDRFLSAEPSVSLSETEKEATVCFESDNWDILGIENSRTGVAVSATDLEGQHSKYLPFEGGETGIVYCKNTFLDLRVEKRNGSELHFISGENLYNQPFETFVRVGNRYEEKVIHVSFSPTRKYQIDSLVYDWSQFRSFDNILEPIEQVTVNTLNASEPVTLYFYPYKNSGRIVEFFMQYGGWGGSKEDLQKLLGDAASQVEIPDIVDGAPGLYGTKVSFCCKEQRLDAGLDKELKVPKTIGPGKNVRLEVYNGIEQYNVPYKVYLSNSLTGKKLVIPGTLSSQKPFNYLIIPIAITDEDE